MANNEQYVLEMNHFADMEWEDIQRHYLGLRNMRDEAFQAIPPLRRHVFGESHGLPSSIDWVEKGAVTKVKNQGRCGSCWAFSSTGALESVVQINTGKLMNLSEQELINGTNGVAMNVGCDGGLMVIAFNYVKENGLCTEDSVPYTSWNGTGDGPGVTLSNPVLGIQPDIVTGFVWVEQTGRSLMSAVLQQPVSVCLEVSSMEFILYAEGVLSQPSCGYDVNHAVVATGYGGYGVKNGVGFWIIRNSWSDQWGAKGYLKLGMNSSQLYDTCGIASLAFYPVVAFS